MYKHGSGIELTFACFYTLKPLVVINVFVVGASAVLIPSPARSAATDSAGFQERATLWTRHHICDRWGDSCSTD